MAETQIRRRYRGTLPTLSANGASADLHVVAVNMGREWIHPHRVLLATKKTMDGTTAICIGTGLTYRAALTDAIANFRRGTRYATSIACRLPEVLSFGT